ncbi:hypothetical protein C8Q80DRAFT_636125 [Daedaleopsis nitida]|nr:hypothetical protein C8Q80DRAFT_636125 [Daedaleopsis nitida]
MARCSPLAQSVARLQISAASRRLRRLAVEEGKPLARSGAAVPVGAHLHAAVVGCASECFQAPRRGVARLLKASRGPRVRSKYEGRKTRVSPPQRSASTFTSLARRQTRYRLRMDVRTWLFLPPRCSPRLPDSRPCFGPLVQRGRRSHRVYFVFSASGTDFHGCGAHRTYAHRAEGTDTRCDRTSRTSHKVVPFSSEFGRVKRQIVAPLGLALHVSYVECSAYRMQCAYRVDVSPHTPTAAEAQNRTLCRALHWQSARVRNRRCETQDSACVPGRLTSRINLKSRASDGWSRLPHGIWRLGRCDPHELGGFVRSSLCHSCLTRGQNMRDHFSTRASTSPSRQIPASDGTNRLS